MLLKIKTSYLWKSLGHKKTWGFLDNIITDEGFLLQPLQTYRQPASRHCLYISTDDFPPNWRPARESKIHFLFLCFYTTHWWLFWDEIMACYLKNIVGFIVLWLTHKICVVWWVNKVVWQWLCHILTDFNSVWHHKKIIVTQQVSCQSIYSNSIWKIIKGTIDIIKSMVSQEIKTSSYQHN